MCTSLKGEYVITHVVAWAVKDNDGRDRSVLKKKKKNVFSATVIEKLPHK